MHARYNKLDLEYGTGIIWSLETAFRRFKIFHKTTTRSCHRNVKVVESRPEMLRHPAIKPMVHCGRSAFAACMIVTYLLHSLSKSDSYRLQGVSPQASRVDTLKRWRKWLY